MTGFPGLVHRLRLNDASDRVELGADRQRYRRRVYVVESCLPFIEQLLALYPDTISTAPPAKLAFLSAANRDAHENYRFWFVTVDHHLRRDLAAGVAAIGSNAESHQPECHRWRRCSFFSPRSSMAAFPYRLLVKSDMEAARLRGKPCYVAGERGDDLLVFCPGSAPPRSEVLPKSSPDLQRLGVIEDILTRIEPAK